MAEEVLSYVDEYARGDESLQRVFLREPLVRVALILEGDAEYAVADSLYTEALRLHWSGNVFGSFRDLASLLFAGAVARIRQQDSTAVTYYLRAGDITSHFAGQRLHAAVLHQLGVLHGRLRRHDEAADFLRSEVEVRREAGTRRGLGVALAFLAESEMAIGDTTGAEPMLREALEVFEADGDELRVQSIRARLAELSGGG